MDNQHRMIPGYRELSQEEIDLINEIKKKGAEVGELIQKVQSLQGIDQRSAAIGRTEIQTGFMWLIRAVAQPTTFC